MTLRGTLQLDKRGRRPKLEKPYLSLRWHSLWLAPLVTLCCWLGYREILSQIVQPQAILVLGGDPKREDFAARLAQQHPNLPVWVSGGSNPGYTEAVFFTDAGISRDRLHLDRTATDTVTNFTTLVDQFKAQGISSVYLVTSDYHMQRSRVIGEIVFGSRGIVLKPVSVPSTTHSETESALKTMRDSARAILWVVTGHTGSTLLHRLETH